MSHSATIQLDDDVTLHIEKTKGGKFKVKLDADFSFQHLTGDLSATITRKTLILARDSINRLLEE